MQATSVIGPSRHFAAAQVAFGAKPDSETCWLSRE
jgi:hypothetical protein